jgi:PAS domain S-box-containing protein
VVAEHTVTLAGVDRRFEFRVVRCAGHRLLTIVRDVTERTRGEVALVERVQRYVAATVAGRAGVWDWNLETNSIYVDPRLKALLGFADHEIPNSIEAWTERVHPADLDRVLEDTQRYLAGATSAFEVEHRMLHKDGSVRWFVARGLVLREPGAPQRLVGTHTDVTERRHAEDAVRHAQAEMHRMSRLAAFGQFSASIAHEVSQPLTAIIMNARACLHWLSQDPADIGEIRAGLLEVIDAGTRADAIVRNNRELFRDHIVAKRRLDVNEVIREVIVLAAGRLDENAVAADAQLGDQLPAVLGDRVELGQVLLNLIFNGIDAMQTVHPRTRELVVTTRATVEGVQVSVRDRGIGFRGVDPQRLFTTGYTTKPSGTGIGLSVCKTIIEAHGGRIWALPHPEAGATFSFLLPATTSGRPTEGPGRSREFRRDARLAESTGHRDSEGPEGCTEISSSRKHTL